MNILPKVKNAKYKCKVCHHDFTVSDVQLGAVLTCPDCGGKMLPAQFVAHICSGQRGARYAVRGMIVGIALWSGLWLVLSTM